MSELSPPGGSEGYGACGDEDNALACVDDFVSQKLGL